MENTRMELNLDELELVNGGWDLKGLWNDIRKAVHAEDEKANPKPKFDPKKIICGNPRQIVG